MSRFLFATLGSLGDLHPYVAVARALVARGHQAVIASAEDYRVAVESAGVEFAAAGPSMASFGDYRALIVRLFDGRHGPEFLMRELVMPHLHAAYAGLERAAAGADVLVSHPLAVTLPLLAQRRNLPWVSTVLAPLSLMSDHDPPVIDGAPWLRHLRRLGPGAYGILFGLIKRSVRHWEAPLREFRAELGLPPMDRMAMFEGQFSPQLNLALFDAPLAQPQPDWPPYTRVCGSPIFDGVAPDTPVSADVARFLDAGEPPVVFALGSSAVWIAGDFWRHAAAATQQLGRRALLVTGPALPQDLPEGVRAFPYVPYSQVFPRAAAVVHQAGIGTLAQALRAGRPQLMVPVAFDQPDNARRAQALGLARTLPFRKAGAQRLAAELAALLLDAAYAGAAGAVAADLAQTDGAACAAAELIAYARGNSGVQGAGIEQTRRRS